MSAPGGDRSARAISVSFEGTRLIVDLADGRSVEAPLDSFSRLLGAEPAERAAWRLIGDGEGIHWPALDEDLSVAGLLRGA